MHNERNRANKAKKKYTAQHNQQRNKNDKHITEYTGHRNASCMYEQREANVYLHFESRATLIFICWFSWSKSGVCVHGLQYRYLCNDTFTIREKATASERIKEKKNHGQVGQQTRNMNDVCSNDDRLSNKVEMITFSSSCILIYIYMCFCMQKSKYLSAGRSFVRSFDVKSQFDACDRNRNTCDFRGLFKSTRKRIVKKSPNARVHASHFWIPWKWRM